MTKNIIIINISTFIFQNLKDFKYNINSFKFHIKNFDDRIKYNSLNKDYLKN